MVLQILPTIVWDACICLCCIALANTAVLASSHTAAPSAVPSTPPHRTKVRSEGCPLDRVDLIGAPLSVVTAALGQRQSGMHLHAWRHRLRNHPHRDMVELTLRGIQYGESLGFVGPRSRLLCRTQLTSAVHRSALLAMVAERGDTLLGPFSEPPCENFRASRLLAVDKDGGTAFRIVHDFSFPRGRSVNDGVDMTQFMCDFHTVSLAMVLVWRVGVDALMLKRDWSGAYRQVCIRFEDYELTGFVIGQKFYLDTRLPFGARSSAAIHGRYSQLFEWVLREEFDISNTLHFADDHLVVCPPDMSECVKTMERFDKAADELGIVFNPKKNVGPATKLVFLGIELDSELMVARVPHDKLVKAFALLHDFATKRKCRVRELQSLIGFLSFLCAVVTAGRTFLARMLALIAGRRHEHRVHLNACFRKDVAWWLAFLCDYNGVGLIGDDEEIRADDLSVGCDASGFAGGAFAGPQWFQVEWSAEERALSIAYKELRVVILAASTWGDAWRGRTVVFMCDNEAAVHAVTGRLVKDALLMDCVRCLHFLEARGQFRVRLVHVAGVSNHIADALSRDRMTLFRSRFRERFGFFPAITPVSVILPLKSSFEYVVV